MARAARAASQVAMGNIDDVGLAVQFATGEKKTALLKVKHYYTNSGSQKHYSLSLWHCSYS